MSSQHPLMLELANLKASLEKYQLAAFGSSLQVQRARFDATEATAHSRTLQAHNAQLQHEIDFLRAHPDTTPNSLQVSELTLALEHVSEKLSVTDDILLQRTTELAHSVSERSRMQLELTAAYAELDEARKREEAAWLWGRELEQKCKAAQEEARMADVVVMEYAALVRTLEGRRWKTSNESTERPPLSPHSSLINDNTNSHNHSKGDRLMQSLAENRFSLQRLLHEFNSETSHLQAEITRLHAEVSSMHIDLECERENSKKDRVKLAEALIDVDRCKTDDTAAAKVVSRYMQFSQSTINKLQTAFSNVKSRHAATMVTLSNTSEELSQSLAVERKRTSQLRDVLDGLAEDILRETFGRRREISLRLQSISREEWTTNALRAWLRRTEERRASFLTQFHATNSTQSSHLGVAAATDELRTILDDMVQDIVTLLSSFSHEERTEHVQENSSLHSVILAQDMVRSLTVDLEREIQKRMALTRIIFKDSLISQLETSEPSATDVIRAESSVQVSPSTGRHLLLSLEGSSVASRSLEADSVSGVVNLSPDTLDPPGTGANVRQPESEQAVAHPLDPSSQTQRKDEVTIISDLSGKDEPRVTPETPLLKELSGISHRYDDLQRAFRDCQSTLAELKAEFAPMTSIRQSSSPLLQNVIHRLDDFCEDTGVELEIRVADEERIRKRFETLLAVPGALASDTDRGSIELELKAFLDDSTSSAVKTIESCTSKLGDLQHDIAQVKRALHESIDIAAEAGSPLPHTPARWSSWTSPFLSGSPSRPASPVPSFGTVITTPRLRRMSSNLLFRPPRVTNISKTAYDDPYAHLGLRIAMPSQTQSDSPSSPELRRTSSTSNMYILGLGSQSRLFPNQEPIIGVPSSDGGEKLETQKSNSDVE